MELSGKKEFSPRNEELSFSRGDRVALVFDGHAEYGWIRWLGHTSESELMAGVEFDNPVGSDNHKVNGHFIFEASPKHGLLVPAASLIRNEDIISGLVQVPSHTTVKTNNCRKHNKLETPLGSDMSSLSTFHKMAYEQLANSGKISGIGSKNISSISGASNCCDKENWDILPHMSYVSHKNIMGSYNKETLNDLKNKPLKTKSRNTNNKSLSSLLDDHKLGPSSNVGTSVPNKSIDQLEVISDGESSQVSTPDQDHESDLGIGSLVEVSFKETTHTPNFRLLSDPTGNHTFLHRLFKLRKTILPYHACILRKRSNSIKHLAYTYGVIRWIGVVPGDKREGRIIAGIEMEDSEDGLSDGTLKGKRYFSCSQSKALFVPLSMCAKDRRFLESLNSSQRASLGEL
ncbi:hypothetical protein Avbf_10754 [Armadillidium vulgare]|nr:hypothetical protein Avbf_10754 [Armadillidium vulgare]